MVLEKKSGYSRIFFEQNAFMGRIIPKKKYLVCASVYEKNRWKEKTSHTSHYLVTQLTVFILKPPFYETCFGQKNEVLGMEDFFSSEDLKRMNFGITGCNFLKNFRHSKKNTKTPLKTTQKT